MEKTTFKERASKRLELWKNNVDQLKNQLENTKEELMETIDKQKKNQL